MFFTDKYEMVGEKLLKTYNVLRYEESQHVYFKHLHKIKHKVTCFFLFYFTVIYQLCLPLLHPTWIIHF